MAMGQNLLPPVHTSQSPLKSTKMGGAPTNQNGTIGFDPQPHNILRQAPRQPSVARGTFFRKSRQEYLLCLDLDGHEGPQRYGDTGLRVLLGIASPSGV